MALIGQRYAEALIGVGIKDGTLTTIEEELAYIVNILDQQAEFKSFLLNPEMKASIKKETLNKLFLGKINPKLLNFLLLLLDKNRISFLPQIYKEFVKLTDTMKNIIYMTIISSRPLEDTQINRIKEKYRALYNASSVKTDFEIDESLIGGIKIKIGDKVYDNSLKGRLESLKAQINNV